MKLSCMSTLVILLVVTQSRAYIISANPRSEAQHDGLVHQAELSRQQLLKRVVFFVTGKWPDRGVFSDTYDDKYIGEEPVNEESFMDELSNDLHPLEEFERKYQHGNYHVIQEQAKNSPNVLVGKERSDITGYGDDSNRVESGEKVTDSSLDQIVDFLLEFVNKMIIAKGKDQIPVPNMSEEFEKRVGFIKLHGKFDAQNGWFKNLSTIQRTGDVIATRRGLDTLVVTCEMGLAVMQFGFNSYQANLAGLSVRGHMTGSVASNSVTIQVAGSFDGGKCNITLEQLTVDRFDGVNVDLTGLGDLSWLLDSIAGWAEKHFKDEIVSSIEENFRNVVSEIVAKYHCSELLHAMEQVQRRKPGQEIPFVTV